MTYSKTICSKNFIKISCIVLCLLVFFNLCQAQETKTKINPVMFEIGIGYPITLNEKTQFFDGFINIGYQQEDLRSSLFAGLFLSTQYRQAWRNDFSISSKLRVGKYLSDNYTMSVDAGYSLYSKRYKALSGLQLGLNFDRTNYYGFHIKYEEYKYGGIMPDRNLVLGIHLSDRKAKKIGLPIVGSAVGIVGLVGIFFLLVVGN